MSILPETRIYKCEKCGWRGTSPKEKIGLLILTDGTTTFSPYKVCPKCGVRVEEERVWRK